MRFGFHDAEKPEPLTANKQIIIRIVASICTSNQVNINDHSGTASLTKNRSEPFKRAPQIDKKDELSSLALSSNETQLAETETADSVIILEAQKLLNKRAGGVT